MPDNREFSRVLFVAVDAWQYGGRDGRQQAELQEVLASAVNSAAEAAGLDPAAWERQDSGDGFLALVHDSKAELALVDPFVRELDARLSRFNSSRRSENRLRLRLAIHHGSAMPAACGYASQGPVVVGRLLDAAPVRAALEAVPDANLVQVVSETIYRDSVRQLFTDLSPDDFTEVVVDTPDKGFRATAWVRVPGASADQLSRLTSPQALAVCVRRPDAPAALADSIRRAALASFDAAGISDVEKISGGGNDFIVPLSAPATGGIVLGVWVDRLTQALADAGSPAVSVGIALDNDLATARQLACGEAATAILTGVADTHAVLVMTGVVHQRFVVGSSARMVAPESFRKVGTEPDSWLRVHGYAVPPEPRADRPSPVPAWVPAATPHSGPVSNIGQATIHGDHITGTVYRYGRMG
ncbi:hypothetical protein [Amycolatopsis sp. La24]|uniref:hypothetical protein n=1 Tax=Amycolatopsis sp. La24 TaxID=3028304 RepID=UPI0023B0388A|nr:hypothetical protein [Amycolatopsis sp. La24]